MMFYVVCTMHEEMKNTCFLVEPQKQGRCFVSGLPSKSLGLFLPVWPQNWWLRFISGLASKPMG
jgi:hypothetical protein